MNPLLQPGAGWRGRPEGTSPVTEHQRSPPMGLRVGSRAAFSICGDWGEPPGGTGGASRGCESLGKAPRPPPSTDSPICVYSSVRVPKQSVWEGQTGDLPLQLEVGRSNFQCCALSGFLPFKVNLFECVIQNVVQ